MQYPSVRVNTVKLLVFVSVSVNFLGREGLGLGREGAFIFEFNWRLAWQLHIHTTLEPCSQNEKIKDVSVRDLNRF